MTSDEPKTLRVERDGALRTVVLNRPDVHDAFDDAMIAEITRAFDDLGDDDDARVILLRSTGRHFCAGADLNWMRRVADHSREENRADAMRLEGMFRAIATCPLPVVVRVQGVALGGGSGLVAAADIAVASSRAKFGFSEARLGILPAVISPYVLRKVAPGTAQALFLTGRRFGADEALRIGLVHSVCDPEELDAAVQEAIDALLACSPRAQARIKALVRRVEHLPLAEAREHTVEAITDARASADGKEGMAAFLDKRDPPWLEP